MLEFQLEFTLDLDSHSDEINNSWVLIIWRITYLDFDLSHNTDFELIVASILFGYIH